MRLLHTATGQFEEIQDIKKVSPYAILSHTWRSKDQGGELTYEHLKKIQALYDHRGFRRTPPPTEHTLSGPFYSTKPAPSTELDAAIKPLAAALPGSPDPVATSVAAGRAPNAETPVTQTFSTPQPSVSPVPVATTQCFVAAAAAACATPEPRQPAPQTASPSSRFSKQRMHGFLQTCADRFKRAALPRLVTKRGINRSASPDAPKPPVSGSPMTSSLVTTTVVAPGPFTLRQHANMQELETATPPVTAPIQVVADAPSAPGTEFSIWDHPMLLKDSKIRRACERARADGYQWIWIDSCCIDKSSSSELSESINSMYLWYGRSRICHAFLADVPAKDDHRAKGSRFRKSKWFTRGWTLQELVAPLDVVFLSEDWTRIGSKHSLADLVEDVTGINYKALLHLEELDKFSLAQRLSWAAKRETTRVEDQAYSLLGIFDINMPTLYGEGSRAFRRLQEEILRRVADQSLFAWGITYLGSEIIHEPTMTASAPVPQTFDCAIRTNVYGKTLLAESHKAFVDGMSIEAVSHTEVLRRLQPFRPPLPEYTSIPHGIRTQVPVIPLSHYLPESATKCDKHTPLSQWYLVILGCEHKDFRGHLLGRICHIAPSESGLEFLRSGDVQINPKPKRGSSFPDLFPLSPATIERCGSQLKLKTVCISHPDRERVTAGTLVYRRHETINLILARETHDALRDRGYTANLRGPDQDHPMTHWFTLVNDEHTITIQFQHTFTDVPYQSGQWFTIDANVQMLRAPSQLDSVGGNHQANPSQVVTMSWTDSKRIGWSADLGNKSVTLTPAGASKCTVILGLAHGGLGSYFLRVEVRNETTAAGSPSPIELPHGGERRVSGTDGGQNGRVEVEGGGDCDSQGGASGEDCPGPGIVDAEQRAG